MDSASPKTIKTGAPGKVESCFRLIHSLGAQRQRLYALLQYSSLHYTVSWYSYSSLPDCEIHKIIALHVSSESFVCADSSVWKARSRSRTKS